MIESGDFTFDDDGYEKKIGSISDNHVISLVDSAHSPEHSLLRSSLASAFDDDSSLKGSIFFGDSVAAGRLAVGPLSKSVRTTSSIHFERYSSVWRIASAAFIRRNFYWVMITRFIQEMGVYAVLPYFQYYLSDVIKVENAAAYTSVLLCIIVVTSVPASLIASPLSNRFGRKVMVYVSCGTMSACIVGFLVISFNPSLLLVMILAGIFGVGYGAYQAVDWALALDCLPENADIAKDLAIWHQTMVIPQALSPLITGFILDNIESRKLGYSVVFSVTIVWFTLATILVQPIKLSQSHIPMHRQLKHSIELSQDSENHSDMDQYQK
ncbi:hypothetical protein PPL_08784 [Heterostelium album PN500]|uniref:Major facilitator superfamily (MFS) profile domain-containing protein n=1 Tax=Heterostelium pallidum (strain ATCC 26659 / Pp 5 / PN500) TaxID=670386 RepID=D3BJQ5_HETP5|nr:hypothetical protein PPL_08784 [Heterostelium album PN500]EFA78135.1 hypothetical protein PPL_08784 [Heterostelium album PN500]|eukprot:XP_020430261.1 hypothetical protein PPL_08784 [Heterostelium album PN500]